MLTVRDLCASAGAFKLDRVTFDLPEGGYGVILGPSGMGKTVLLETLAGLRRTDSGSIDVDGEPVANVPVQDRGLVLVYQDQALFPHLNVHDNIAYGLRARRRPSSEIGTRVATLMHEVGLKDAGRRSVATLSGGERQRVALARALATDPQVLLLDEPLAALDPEARAELRALLRTLHRNGQTVLHVTHDYEEAVSLADSVAVLEDGRIVETGTPVAVFQHPRSRFTARFIGIRNFFPGTLEPPDDAGTAEFKADGPSMWAVTDAPAGPGFLILRSEDITLSREAPAGSARNVFEGRVTDVVPARLGIEVIVDIGVEAAALVTPGAVAALKLVPGASVWVSFKATAARVIAE